MPKYLRQILWDPERAVLAVLGDDTAHLGWMYEHYATPFPTGGIQKLFVVFTPDAARVGPSEEFLPNILRVRKFLDAAAYPSLSGPARERYYLDRLHEGVVRCARACGWDEGHFAAARDQMLADGLRFAFWWKKPLLSPARRLKAQGRVEAGTLTRLSVVFTNRRGEELRRGLLAEFPTGNRPDLRHVFGHFEWIDGETVRVTQDNGRDYWVCTADGRVEFHSPRAARGDPHGEYDLGRMYYDGILQHLGLDRGLVLIRSSAAKGYKHAVTFLDRLDSGHTHSQ